MTEVELPAVKEASPETVAEASPETVAVAVPSAGVETADPSSCIGGGCKPTCCPPEELVTKKSAFKMNWFTTWCLLWEAAMIIIFGTAAAFENGANGNAGAFPAMYTMMQDTSTMVFIGFGALYMLFRRYAWTGVSWNYLIAVFVLQWSLICLGFWKSVNGRRSDVENGFPAVPLDTAQMTKALYTAATLLVSFGALMGRVSATQMLMLAFWGTIFATGNYQIAETLHVSDPGGSMAIHVFGAVFGLTLAAMVGDKPGKGQCNGESKMHTSRHNGTFAMIGTLFLFIGWPSFNAALLTGEAQQRAAFNTLMSISSSTIAAFAFSRATHGGKKFDMESIQNATLAGGVAIGAACDMLRNPWGAMLTGFVAGAVSVYGFAFLTPALKKRGLADTCGIADLHFMPGVIGAIASAVAAAGIEDGAHGWTTASINAAFLARADGKTAIQAGAYQIAHLAISIAIAVLGGIFTGWLMRQRFSEPASCKFFEDSAYWVVADEANAEDADGKDPKTGLTAAQIAAVREAVLSSVLVEVSSVLGRDVSGLVQRSA